MIYAAESPAIAPDTKPYHFASIDGKLYYEINQAVTAENAAQVRSFLVQPAGRTKPLAFAKRWLHARGATFTEETEC